MEQVIYKRDSCSKYFFLCYFVSCAGPYLTQMDDDRRLLVFVDHSNGGGNIIREREGEGWNRSAATSVLQCYKLRDIRRYHMANGGWRLLCGLNNKWADTWRLLQSYFAHCWESDGNCDHSYCNNLLEQRNTKWFVGKLLWCNLRKRTEPL